MSQQQSHRHHYVPQWYQRRFLGPGQTAFKVLDLEPEVFRDKSGNVRGRGRSVLDKGPDAWFFEKDLYTTRWLGTSNDDIERLLFGAIDKAGQKGFDAVIADDWGAMHDYYPAFFEFLDALRLRTPKGLLFLRHALKPRSQNELLIAMQRTRTMHCVMWGEGGREILTVPDDAKTHLIFSDHPVTFYNRHVFPRAPGIPAFLDPFQQWQGTQTLVPLDRSRLAVFTHSEWGRAPDNKRATTNRTNARMFDTPMFRFDDWHRKRSLTEEQVLAVNYIVKMRAHRYIAGTAVEDLYPEKKLKDRIWNKVGAFLHPPEMAVNTQVGYTVVGFKDGGYHFEDQYGRRPRSKAEYDREVERAKTMEAHFKQLISKHRAENGAPPPDFDD